MSNIPFSEKELTIVGRRPSRFNPDGPGDPIYDFPINTKEAMRAVYERRAYWIPTNMETTIFTPKIVPDNVARGMIFEANQVPMEEFGGPDMFGVKWVYVPVVGGSMEDPDEPHKFEDANDWKESLVFPDIDSWDWDQSGRDNYEYLKNGKFNMFWIQNGGGFERLISFMGFENAAMALIDEDQEDALKELLQALADLHIRLIDKVVETYGDGVDGFTYHDDWGSQAAPFFSEDVATEFFTPYQRQITDHMKARGKVADLHSCGHIEDRIKNIIAGGWQSWTPMSMNDTHKLYDDYGDQIIIGMCDDPLPKDADEAVQAARAEAFAKRYFSPSKPCTYSHYSPAGLTDAYRAALYRTTRQM